MSVDLAERQVVDPAQVAEAASGLRGVLSGVPVEVARRALREVTGEMGVLSPPKLESVDHGGVLDGQSRAAEIRDQAGLETANRQNQRSRYAAFWSAPAKDRETARLRYEADDARARAEYLAAQLTRADLTVGQTIDLQQELAATNKFINWATGITDRRTRTTERRQGNIKMVDAEIAKARSVARAATLPYASVLSALDVGLTRPGANPAVNALVLMQLLEDVSVAAGVRTAAREELQRQIAIAKMGTPQEAPHILRRHQLRIGGLVLLAWGRREFRTHKPSVRQAKRYKVKEKEYDRLTQRGKSTELPEYAQYFFEQPSSVEVRRRSGRTAVVLVASN